MSTLRIVSLSLVLLSGAPVAAWAQDARPGIDRAGPPADEGRWNPAAMREHEEARRAEHLKAFRDVLGIQPGQEAAFTAFAAAMRPPEAHDGDRDRDGRGAQGDHADRQSVMTTPERLDLMKARMDRKFAEMREAFDRRAQATRALYAVLDPRQRTVMDALPELIGHHGGERPGPMDRHGPMRPGL